MQPHERIIVALDKKDITSVSILVSELYNYVGGFKAGYELFYSIMADLILLPEEEAIAKLHTLRELMTLIGPKAFFDVKLNDIPNTVQGAVEALAILKPRIINLHASAPAESIIRAVANKRDSKIFVVTVLTCLGDLECKSIFGDEVNEKVFKFADKAVNLGVDGIICAPKEGEMLRKYTQFDKTEIACPNIRPSFAATKDDQNTARQMDPYRARMAGIDYLVIGRPITNPPAEIGGPVEAAKRIAEEITMADDY